MASAVPLDGLSWTPPLSEMNFSRPENCAACTKFLSSWALGAKDHLGLPRITPTAACFRAALPASAREVPSDLQLIELFLLLHEAVNTTYEGYFVDKVAMPIRLGCEADFCRSLGWEGNSDLAGVGVLISYFIEATLCTAYYTAFMLSFLARPPNPPPQDLNCGRLKDKILGAFEGTMPTIRITATLFSLIVLIAALVVTGRARVSPLDITLYEVEMSVLVSAFAILPVLLLSIFESREHYDWIFWHATRGLIVLLLLVEMVLILDTDPTVNYSVGSGTPDPFEIFCDRHKKVLIQAVSGVVVVLGALTILGPLFGVCYRRFGWDRVGALGIIRHRGKQGCASFLLLAMWALLIVLTVYRARLFRISGGSSEENEMSFGQVVALAAWVPAILDLLQSYRQVRKATSEKIRDDQESQNLVEAIELAPRSSPSSDVPEETRNILNHQTW